MSTFPLSLPHLEELDQTFYTFSILHPLAWPLFGLFISPNQWQTLLDVSHCIAIYEVQMKLFALVKSMHTALWRQTSRSRSEPQWFFITALSPRYFCELMNEWKQYVGPTLFAIWHALLRLLLSKIPITPRAVVSRQSLQCDGLLRSEESCQINHDVFVN